MLSLGNFSSILDLCLRNSLAGKSRNHRDVIILENFSFNHFFFPHQSRKPVFSNASLLKIAFGKLRFRDGLVLMVSLTVKVKLCFLNSQA